MGNDEVTTGFHCNLQDHVVLRIPKHWPPEEEDLPVVTDGAQVVQNGIDVVVGQFWNSLGAFQRRFIFQDQWNREVDFEPAISADQR